MHNANIVCVIMKAPVDAPYAREIRMNVEYVEEQYLDFAIIPPELVTGIVETEGFCDVELSEDAKTVVAFTPRGKPVFPEPQPTADEIIDALLGVTE